MVIIKYIKKWHKAFHYLQLQSKNTVKPYYGIHPVTFLVLSWSTSWNRSAISVLS